MRHPMNDLPVGLSGTETLKGRALAALSGVLGRTRGTASVRLTNDVLDAETVTVTLADGRVFVFEFDDDSTFTAGNVQVDVTGDLTPTAATAALATAMGTSLAGVFTVTNPSINEVLLVGSGPGSVGATFAETSVGADNDVDAALKGDVAHGSPAVLATARVPTAAEVALGELHVAADFVIDGWVIRVETTATGVVVAWDGVALKETGGDVLTVGNGGAVDWAATDTVHVLAWGRNVAAEDQVHSD